MTTKKTHVAPPDEVEALCPGCREHGPHRVEKGHVAKRGSAVEGAFTCRGCGHTHQGLVEVPVPVDIALLVGDDEGQTQPFRVQVMQGEEVQVGDEFEVEDVLVEVTAVELHDARRVQRAPAEKVMTLWGKDITQIKVAFAMNLGSSTRSFETPFNPDDTIGVGDTFDLDGTDVEVKQVITTEGRRRHGRHNVREIKRVWLKRRGRDERPRGATARPSKPGGRSSRPSTGGPPRARGRPPASRGPPKSRGRR